MTCRPFLLRYRLIEENHLSSNFVLIQNMEKIYTHVQTNIFFKWPLQKNSLKSDFLWLTEISIFSVKRFVVKVDITILA
jgi:hypothetical protein